MGLMGEQHGTRLMSQLRSGVVLLSLLLLICLTKYVCDAKQDQFLAFLVFFALSTFYIIRIYRVCLLFMDL